MTTPTVSRLVRAGRLLSPGRNPLARGVDRVEAALLLLSIVLVLALVPVMLTVGSLTYADLVETSEREAGARHQTVAVLTQDAPSARVGERGAPVTGDSAVPARWRLADGTVRTGKVRADDGLKAGAEVRVWLDASGRPTDPPLSTLDAAVTAVLLFTLGWLVVLGLLAMALFGVHQLCEQRRYRAWAQEWAQVAPDWPNQQR